MKTRFCVICGTGIVTHYSGGRGINYPICKNRDCIETYSNFRKVASLPKINKYSDPETRFQQQKTERFDGFCGRCGKPLKIDFRNNYLRHGSLNRCEKASVIRNPSKIGKTRFILQFSFHKPKPKPRIYLKPWQDPESLFCDTEFLETEILRKKIRPGKECSDDRL